MLTGARERGREEEKEGKGRREEGRKEREGRSEERNSHVIYKEG